MPSNRERADAALRRMWDRCIRLYPQDTVSASKITLRLSGEIGPRAAFNANRVRAALRRYPNACAEFIIDSRGGNLLEAKKISELIMAHQGDTIGTVHQECSSAAVTAFLSADFRQCGPNARFLIHSVEITPRTGERWTANRHRKTLAHLEHLDRAIIDFCAERTGYSRKEFEREIVTEGMLTPAAAHRLGLVYAYIDDVRWLNGKPYAHPISSRAMAQSRLVRRTLFGDRAMIW